MVHATASTSSDCAMYTRPEVDADYVEISKVKAHHTTYQLLNGS